MLSRQLEGYINRSDLPPPRFEVGQIRCETLMVSARDGTRLATDLYLPPVSHAPVVAVRTPYARNKDDNGLVGSLMAFARRGYIAVSQDCRGTGGSEPDSWDYYMYESEDSYDLVQWISEQAWFDGFVGSFGGSYVGQTQWCMATHPAMSATAPNVSGLGIAYNTAHLYLFLNAYARAIGKGPDKVSVPYYELERVMMDETLAGGYFNEPLHAPPSAELVVRFPQLRTMTPTAGKRWLWAQYCGMSCAERAQFVRQALGVRSVTSVDVESLPAIFGHRVSHDAHTIPDVDAEHRCRRIHAPPLLRTGWYDWCLNDALATWESLRRAGRPEVAERARFVITPYAHNTAGYHEGVETHPELFPKASLLNSVALLHAWFEAVRERTTASWPRVIYYLMGANEWRVASDWPVPEAQSCAFYLGGGGALTRDGPSPSPPDRYVYDPRDPTPTVGGSIVSYVYPAGSVDVSEAQKRADVLMFTTPPLEHDLDIVGPVRMILYASSSARDTDFVARLSDAFPDGRAIHLQSGILRARYRDPEGDPRLLEPGKIYRFEIDLWATANRFKAGHRLRVDISSADFPHYDRNSNRGGEAGEPLPAQQTIYHDPEHPSHLLVAVLPSYSGS